MSCCWWHCCNWATWWSCLEGVKGSCSLLGVCGCPDWVACCRCVPFLLCVQVLFRTYAYPCARPSLCVRARVFGTNAYNHVACLPQRRNPCTSSCSSASKYRDCIILAAADSLEQLDGEEVTPAHRAFLHALHSRRAKARQQQQLLQEQEQLSQQVSSMHMGGGDEHPSANTADAAAEQEYGSHMGAIAAGHHTHAVQQSPRTRAARCGAQGALGPAVAGMKLQLAAALQPCRAGAPRPSPAAGFKPSPKKAAMRRGPAAAAGAVEGDAGGFDGHL